MDKRRPIYKVLTSVGVGLIVLPEPITTVVGVFVILMALSFKKFEGKACQKN